MLRNRFYNPALKPTHNHIMNTSFYHFILSLSLPLLHTQTHKSKLGGENRKISRFTAFRSNSEFSANCREKK